MKVVKNLLVMHQLVYSSLCPLALLRRIVCRHGQMCMAGSLVLSLLSLTPSLGLAANSQTPISNPPIKIFAASPALGEVTATSEFNCAKDNCRWLYTLSTDGIDPANGTVKVTWSLGSYKLSETMLIRGDFKQWYLDMPNGVLALLKNPPKKTGNVRFTNVTGFVNTMGTADYYEPQNQPIPLKGFVESMIDKMFGLDNGLVENPTLASYHSSVELLPGGDYRYSYTVTNGAGSSLTYDWPDAGISGELEVGESITHTFDTPMLPFAVVGQSSTSYMEELDSVNELRQYETPTSAIVPLVPEPSCIVLLLASLPLLGLRR